jgi:aminoglycoside 6'-N-acetyltransferase I
VIQIVDLGETEPALIAQVAGLLIDGFSDTGSTSWRTRDAALETVHESLAVDRVSCVALDDSGAAVGWIAGLPSYDGYVWELHPMVVRRDCQRRGIGRALIADFEARVRERGGSTIYLGTDDENGRTNIGGRDLYPDPLHAATTIASTAGHPVEFYRKVGFVVVGVLPDANGFGKPDILMAKRVARP